MKEAARTALILLGMWVLLWVLASRADGATPSEASDPPSAFRPSWSSTIATWYGPGFYGHTTRCGQHYTQQIRGIAARSMRCGTRLTICRSGRCVRVKVIDGGGRFDLSARTAMDLCKCSRPYTMRVRWTYGWVHR